MFKFGHCSSIRYCTNQHYWEKIINDLDLCIHVFHHIWSLDVLLHIFHHCAVWYHHYSLRKNIWNNFLKLVENRQKNSYFAQYLKFRYFEWKNIFTSGTFADKLLIWYMYLCVYILTFLVHCCKLQLMWYNLQSIIS